MRFGRTTQLTLTLALSLPLTACARGPNVSSDLPLRRVVIYRNGVGYFERAGHVDSETVKFRMRGRMVGDFLATLAIVERGGGTVRSASFPIDVKDEDKPEPPGPVPLVPLCRPDIVCPPPPKENKDAHDPNALRNVVLSLDGATHDLSIGYVAETPVWRPSYRVVVEDGNQADLQTWGIVQNLSGEAWNDVELVLVAGAPIAFQSTLGTPVIPTRPIVNDKGEVIASVPTAETSLAEAPAAPPPPPPAVAAEPAAMAEDEAEPAQAAGSMGYGRAAPAPKAMMSKTTSMRGRAVLRADKAEANGAPPAESVSAPRSMSALAAVAVEAGTTRYGLPQRVNVPDESATMVLLLHERVPGGAVFLFAPDGGVPDSYSHPFRVARFTNTSSGMLERGPIAVFEKGSFLGEGVLESLPPKATATVPFALERGLAVQSASRYDELGARIWKIEASQLWIERDRVQKTTYKVKNGGGEAAHLLVKHPRTPGSRLFQPPKGTEDNTGTGSALIPVNVPPFGNAELVVDERSPYQQSIDWLDDLANLAVKDYLADKRSDPKVVATLTQAWTIRDKLRASNDERTQLLTEQGDLARSTGETRANLKALQKNKHAADLVAKLTDRLRKDSDRLDAITKRLIEIDLAVREQEVRFRDAIRDVSLVNTAAPKA